MDDASSDRTAEMVTTTFPDSRIKVFPSLRAGVSAARNTGLRHSRGQFISYIDSDNVWTPEYLEVSLLQMLRTGSTTAYSAMRRFRKGLEVAEEFYILFDAFDIDRLIYANYIDLNVFVHRREVLDQAGGFDEAFERMVDWDLIIRYCKLYTPVQCYFIGADYDDADRSDRITQSKSIAYQNVVRNKHWIDWVQLSETVDARENDLVSIVICVLDNPELTDACLTSIFEQPAGKLFELIIVDNGSNAPTQELLENWNRRHSEIKLVRNSTNLNFALGNNLGFAGTRGRRVVFLNNDTEVTPEWLSALLTPLEEPDILGVQPELLFPDGTMQNLGVVFSDYSSFGYCLYKGLAGDHELAMDRRRFRAVTAACIALRAEDFIRARGFDPIFVNGQEDMDLCLRIGEGKEVFTCATDCVVVHHEGKSAGRSNAILANRLVFHTRYAGKFAATDTAHYVRDNVTVLKYQAQNAPPGLAIFEPKLDLQYQTKPPALRKNVQIQLQIPSPSHGATDKSEDYHFAVALTKAFVRQGIDAKISFLGDVNRAGTASDFNLILRGSSPHPKGLDHPATGRCAIWIMSTPEFMNDEELEGCDVIFVASESFTKGLIGRGLSTPILPLLLCTEAERFFPEAARPDLRRERLYVGDADGTPSAIVLKAVDEALPVDIYGAGWDGLVPSHWIKGGRIPNERLASYYASAGTVLCRHSVNMVNGGFPSNRIFDVLACGAPVVTDGVSSLPVALSEACVVFGQDGHVATAIEQAITHSDAGRRKDLSDLIRHEHSFNNRVRTILEVLDT